MTKLDTRISTLTTLAAIGSFLLTLAASFRARGLRQTLLFAIFGLGFPSRPNTTPSTTGEVCAITSNRSGKAAHFRKTTACCPAVNIEGYGRIHRMDGLILDDNWGVYGICAKQLHFIPAKVAFSQVISQALSQGAPP